MSVIKELEAPWAIEKGGTPDILLTCNGEVMCSFNSRGRLTFYGRSASAPIEHVEALIKAWRERQAEVKP